MQHPHVQRVPFRLACTLAAAAALAPATAAQGAPTIDWAAAGHSEVSSVATTPDGQTLVTASFDDHTIKVWHAADGGYLRMLNQSIGGLHSIALSPDGTRVVSGGEFVFGAGQSNVLVRDLATTDIVLQLAGEASEVFGVAWSPDGNLIAAGDQLGRILIWSAVSGTLVRTIPAPGGFASTFAVTFSPDNLSLAAGYGDNKARLFRVSNGALLKTFTGHTFFVDAVAFSPDGSQLATGSWDNAARIWSVSTGASLHTLTGHTDIVRSVAYSPDGQSILSGSWDNSLRLWNAATGAPQQTLTTPGLISVNDARWVAGGAQVASGSIDGHPRLWNAATGAVTQTFGHHTQSIYALDASADGQRLVSTSADQQAKVWNAADGAELLTLVGHTDVINAVSVSPDHLLIATGAGSPPPDTKDPSARLWNGATGALLFTLTGHVGGTTAVDLSPLSAVLASGGRDSTVRFWSTVTGAPMGTIPGQTGGIRALAYSPDGLSLAVASSTRIRIFRTSDNALLQTLQDVDIVGSLSWSPDGHRLAASLDAIGENAKIWNVDTGTVAQALPAESISFLQSVAFSPDGLRVATASGFSGIIRTWFAADGTLLKTYDEETGTHGINPRLPLAYLPDGRLAYGRTDPVVVMSDCDGTITAYGNGTAGSGGFVPSLQLSGCASPGSLVQFAISDALGGGSALLLFGLGAGSAQVKGCELLVAPLLPVIVALPLGGSGPGNGSLQFPALVPPGTPDVTLAVQVYVTDAAGSAGFASSNGVLLDIR